MNVLELEDVDSLERGRSGVDLTRCTRCSQPWGYDLVEKVEIWTCGSCGYEARERTTDFRRILIARREARIS